MLLQEYKEMDGIKIFHDDIDEHHADYNSQGLDNLFKEEERHFWFLARKEFIFQSMKSVIKFTSKVIEIGAGTGNVSRYLKEKGFSNIAVGEMHSNGLRYAKSYGIDECYQFDLLRAPFAHEFDTICMFDVLEHIEEDKTALVNIHKMLKSEGKVVLTVPAHRWLWSRDDAVAGHKRRYTKKELTSKLIEAGFDIEVSRYFFILIVPLLWLRRLLHRDTGEVVLTKELSNDFSINPTVSTILYYISKLESMANKFLPNFFGGSLLVIARKNDSV
ncbi:MAG: class I SAM-dependent methyltransferase [Ghiorsea sp.]|nr:class I SAM-dependent methyltransferase [Ghiorsea sp.]